MTTADQTSRGLLGYSSGALAGVLSAVILAIAFSRAESILVLSAYIATVPLFLAGFGAGTLAGVIACVCGSAALFITLPPGTGTFYLMADAIPAIGLIFLAMRKSPTRDGAYEFASEGNLISALAIYPCIIFLLIYIQLNGHDGGLLGMTTEALDGMNDHVIAMITPPGEKAAPEIVLKVHQYLQMIAQITPALGMCVWLFSTLIAMAVAQAILQQQAWALRPSFSLMRLHVPNWVIFAAAITGVIGGFAPPPYNYLGLNLALVLGVPFFFVGLSVVHAWAAQTRAPILALIIFYISISVIIHLVLLVALLGAVDQWVDFRKRLADRAKHKK